MEKMKPQSALGMLVLTVVILYLVGSLFSLSFSFDEWNLFSKIILIGPSLILSVWTLKDYFIDY